MEIEERLEALEELARERLAESFAVDWMIRALIVSHPNPQAIRTIFEAQLHRAEFELSERGFARGASAESARAVNLQMRKLADAWLAVLPIQPIGPTGPG